jgi:hypothetical protein
MDDRLERVLFTASGSVRTSRTGAYRSEQSGAGSEQNSERQQQRASLWVTLGSRHGRGEEGLPGLWAFGMETNGISWRFGSTQPQFQKPLSKTFILYTFTTLIASQDVQHRMQSATACSACIIHSQIPPANSPPPVSKHSPTMIHTRRALQNTRLLIYLTLLNWYKLTLSRPDINLKSIIQFRSLKAVSGEWRGHTCRGRQILTPSCERTIYTSKCSVSTRQRQGLSKCVRTCRQCASHPTIRGTANMTGK